MSDLPTHNELIPDKTIGQGAAGPVEEAQTGEQEQLVIDPPVIKEAIGQQESVAEEEEAQEGDEAADAARATSEDEVEDGLEGEVDIEDDPTHDQLPSRDLNGAPQISVSLEAESEDSEKPASDAGADTVHSTADVLADGADDPAVEEGQSPAHPATTLRSVTPGSRTSTPPLSSSAPAAKKFSSVNINKKFLSKTVSPAPGPGVAGAKISSLGGRPAASPVPIATASTKLVSSKLTTLPSSKTGPSPIPPTGSSSANSSPWAKPALPLPDSKPAPGTLHQPAPQKGRTLSSMGPVAMGSGQGIGGGAARSAWRTVSSDSRRPGLGMSREFPTASEVAEGKKAAVLAAQAQAAHNQAILQGLNVFSQLDAAGAHRWDDEDDDDDVIDFGDGMVAHPHEHHDEPLAREPSNEVPVSKTDRFAEDFDRSWPRKPPPIEAPRRQDSEGRQLFNAQSNRMEPSQPRGQPALPQPTRLMSRPMTEPSQEPRASGPTPAAGRAFERPLPPHLQGGDQGRMLPPHMTAPPADLPKPPMREVRELPPHQQPAPASTTRQAWGARVEAERPEVSPPGVSHHPRRSFSEVRRPDGTLPPGIGPGSHLPHPPHLPPAPEEAVVTSPTDPTLDQAAEMHTAAEKARLRRLAEEQEREAAAERARQKAKELEERFGPKKATSASAVAAPSVPAKPAPAPTPSYTIAQRPKPPAEVTPAPAPLVKQVAPTVLPSLPSKPPADASRGTESSWRSRQASQPVADITPPAPTTTKVQAPSANHRVNRPTAEMYFDSAVESTITRDGELPSVPSAPTVEATSQPTVNVRLPGQPPIPVPVEESVLKEAIKRAGVGEAAEKTGTPKHNFDDMLSRIKAAMEQARISPAPAAPAKLPEEQLKSQEGPAVITYSSRRTGPVPNTAQASQPLASAIKPAKSLVVEYFDVTQPAPPKSPPPAWRTFKVVLPRNTPAKLPIPRNRLRLAETQVAHGPPGWLLSFEPPVARLHFLNLSLPELLLPRQPKRFGRDISLPVVSISPRKLERVEKRSKRAQQTVREGVTPTQPIAPPSSIESLLPGAQAASTAASSLLKSQATRAQSASRWTDDSRPGDRGNGVAAPVPPERRKSPIKPSPAAKAEREGRFATDSVGISTDKAVGEARPGVRFMVSSELEGDSLLDEINKMSLETVGDASDEQHAVPTVASGAETPKTPPSHIPSGTSSRAGGHVASPNGPGPNQTPWAAHVSQQRHEHLKSMWEQADKSQGADLTGASDRASLSVSASQQGQVADLSTPLYPTLNAPSSSDPPASQSKVGYTPSSFAAANSGVPLNAFSLRSTSGYGQYMSPSGSHHGMNSGEGANPNAIGLSYGRTNGTTSTMNGFPPVAGQQGVWSPAAFGSSMPASGYGYAVRPQDQKAAAAFGAASSGGNKEMYSPVGADYRFGSPHHASANLYQTPQGQYSTGNRTFTSPIHDSGAGYGYNYPGSASIAAASRGLNSAQSQGQAGGRFGHSGPQQQHPAGAVGSGMGTNGLGEFHYGSVADAPASGYYGGVYGQTQAAGASGPGNQAQATRGLNGRKMW